MEPIANKLHRLRSVALPLWIKWATLAVLFLTAYGFGRVHEARRSADVMLGYVGKHVAQTAVIVKRQVEVVTKSEIRYRDRVQKIYVEGKQIAERIPDYVTPALDERYALPAGFLRVLDAAWSGNAPGPATEFDAEPAGIPLSVISANETDNATSCRAWREQALGWREFYASQQVAINGKAGAWTAGAHLSPASAD